MELLPVSANLELVDDSFNAYSCSNRTVFSRSRIISTGHQVIECKWVI